MTFESAKHHTLTIGDDEYIRFSENNWYKFYGNSLESVTYSTELDKMYSKYAYDKYISECKTIQQEGEEVNEAAKKETIKILTTVLASMDKEDDIEKAVIYAVTTHVKCKHGFVEAIPYDYRPFKDNANQAIARVGTNYNPYVTYIVDT